MRGSSGGLTRLPHPCHAGRTAHPLTPVQPKGARGQAAVVGFHLSRSSMRVRRANLSSIRQLCALIADFLPVTVRIKALVAHPLHLHVWPALYFCSSCLLRLSPAGCDLPVCKLSAFAVAISALHVPGTRSRPRQTEHGRSSAGGRPLLPFLSKGPEHGLFGPDRGQPRAERERAQPTPQAAAAPIVHAGSMARGRLVLVLLFGQRALVDPGLHAELGRVEARADAESRRMRGAAVFGSAAGMLESGCCQRLRRNVPPRSDITMPSGDGVPGQADGEDAKNDDLRRRHRNGSQ
jgi:hypothetical protein